MSPARAAASTLAMAGLAAACVPLSACIGPNFHRPVPPATQTYTSQPLPEVTESAPGPGGAAQHFLSGADVPRDWWSLFASPEIDALVSEALRANPDVQSAQAALRQANENTAAQRGSYFPAVNGEFDAERHHDPTGVLSPNLTSGAAVYNLFTPQVTVSYVPDIFGANRRAVESLAAQAEAARYQLDATYLTLTANVVSTAILESSYRNQITVTQRVIGFEREALGVMHKQLELGAIAEGDVFAQEAALAQLETTLPPLLKQLRQTHDQLAVYTGHLPSDSPPVALELGQLTLPTDLPLGVPSALVERRPDVRAAEAQMHAATAAVGVAITNMLPQLTLTGTWGSSATRMTDLFKDGTGFWSLGATASQTLFAGGTLLHKKRAADAALDQAGAAYKSAVLTAFQNVADALHAIDTDAQSMSVAARAQDAAQKSLDVVRAQLELGSVSYLALLNAEQAYDQATLSLVQARANRFTDTAALFQALGGSITPQPSTARR